MHLPAAIRLPAAAFTAEEPCFAVGIPVAMINPATEEPGAPRHGASGMLFGLALIEKGPDGGGEFGRDDFIAIEIQDPGLRAEFQAAIFLSGVAEPVLMDERGAKFRCDLRRSILGAGVEDHDFRGQIRHAGQAPAQIGLLVERDEGDRERQARHAPDSAASIARAKYERAGG